MLSRPSFRAKFIQRPIQMRIVLVIMKACFLVLHFGLNLFKRGRSILIVKESSSSHKPVRVFNLLRNSVRLFYVRGRKETACANEPSCQLGLLRNKIFYFRSYDLCLLKNWTDLRFHSTQNDSFDSKRKFLI